MSSTQRGGKRSEADVYTTPRWCVDRLLDALNLSSGDMLDTFRLDHGEHGFHRMKRGRWMEPCAGDGAIVQAVNEWAKENKCGAAHSKVNWTMFELRPECLGSLVQLITPGSCASILDFFSRTVRGETYDVVLTNPPFSIAMEFIRACLPIATHCFFLQRMNFLGSEERSVFMRETTPDLYILPNRPSFASPDAQGKRRWTTDSIEYAWFHWFKGRGEGRYTMLASTPIDERKRRA